MADDPGGQKCSKCNREAVTFIRYNGMHLCHEHFTDFVRRRIKREAKKQGRLHSGEIVGVAVSGGKDSVVTLHIMAEMISRRPDVRLVALTIDEGIDGYRDKSIEVVKHNCEQLGVPLHIRSFKEATGFSMDEIAVFNDEIGECSYCGVFRRFCLNTLANELGVTRLVTGHNLDDMAQSILMNMVTGNVEKMGRLGPHIKVREGLIPRRMPLRLIPEKEVMLYALLERIEFYDGECPYSLRAARGTARDIVDLLEEKTPGSRHSILKSYESIKGLLDKKNEGSPEVALSNCPLCGEPTSQNLCKCCILKERLRMLSDSKSR